MVEEELEVLASIFGGRDELEVICRDPTTIIVLRLKSENENNSVSFDLSVEVGKDYPERSRPSAVVTSSSLSNSACAKLKNGLKAFIAEEIDLGNPAILDIATWCQQKVWSYSEQQLVEYDPSKFKVKSTMVTLIEIDHMRERRSYCKLLESWSNELGITGRIMFVGKANAPKPKIFVFIESEESKSLGEFVKRLGTVKVDVDSQGRPCKEKMKNVICSEVEVKDRSFGDFRVECVEELSGFATQCGLSEWLKKYMMI